MRVYHYFADGDKYRGLRLVWPEEDLAHLNFLESLNGRRLEAEWIPFKVEIEPKWWKRWPDLWSISSRPTFNRRAREVFEPLLEQVVEFLPVKVVNYDYELFFVNVLDVEDCVDYERATWRWVEFEDIDKLKLIKKYKFHAECVERKLIFKVRSGRAWKDIITERFVEVTNRHKLKGLYLGRLAFLDDTASDE
jgi:thiol-disulfide isomerase/thioredoxin